MWTSVTKTTLVSDQQTIGAKAFVDRMYSLLNKAFRILVVMGAATQLTACSKTMQWEEEVPLNTGEVIWVKRTDTYVKGSEPGNPLKMTWGIETRAYEFLWQGQQYTYQTEPKVSLGAFLIHVFPADKVVAIVDATRQCAKPGYGEFRWAGGAWQLQKNVSPALVGQPRNLMAYYSAEDGAIPARVSKEIRNAQDTRPRRGERLLNLEPSKIAIDCTGRR
jgi:hypothetical protein